MMKVIYQFRVGGAGCAPNIWCKIKQNVDFSHPKLGSNFELGKIGGGEQP